MTAKHGRGTVVFGCVAALAALLVAGCSEQDGQNVDAVYLGIADRAWAPGHDDVGWCGETCIQMALAYYGLELSQEAINEAAGSPSDIIEDNMDAALVTLGVTYEAWDDSNHDVGQFVEWVKAQLRGGRPVICGTKIYPDENPDWYVDHFVLAVGFDATGLILNTQLDCDGQLLVTYAELVSMEEGYSFQNSQMRYFGRAIIAVP